jgi:hypothetical protein
VQADLKVCCDAMSDLAVELRLTGSPLDVTAVSARPRRGNRSRHPA